LLETVEDQAFSNLPGFSPFRQKAISSDQSFPLAANTLKTMQDQHFVQPSGGSSGLVQTSVLYPKHSKNREFRGKMILLLSSLVKSLD